MVSQESHRSLVNLLVFPLFSLQSISKWFGNWLRNLNIRRTMREKRERTGYYLVWFDLAIHGLWLYNPVRGLDQEGRFRKTIAANSGKGQEKQQISVSLSSYFKILSRKEEVDPRGNDLRYIFRGPHWQRHRWVWRDNEEGGPRHSSL